MGSAMTSMVRDTKPNIKQKWGAGDVNQKAIFFKHPILLMPVLLKRISCVPLV